MINTNSAIINWLLESDPWTAYRTYIDLLGRPEDDQDVQRKRGELLEHPQIEGLLAEMKNWPGPPVSSHKQAGLLYHKLAFLSQIGLTQNDPGISELAEQIFAQAAEEGPPRVPMQIPVHFGGSGEEQLAWALCDAPVIVSSLARMGYRNDERVTRAREYLVRLGKENAYPCTVSKELNGFRGPGKKDDPCPYATLVMLELIGLWPGCRDTEYALNAVATLLDLWENSRSKHPYIFYMGNDFRKLKVPMVWYDIIHVADVLSAFPYATGDKRFLDMVEQINLQADGEGRYTPGSEWKAWSGWDFARKKKPSPWLTFLVLRIGSRLNAGSGSSL